MQVCEQNSSLCAGEQGPEPLPVYAKAIITVMYTSVCLLAVAGNLVVCHTVLSSRRMRTVTNCFIVNLAVSDMLVAILCIPFTFIANMLVNYWPFGRVMCPLVTYVQVVTVFLSAFTLVAISLDRFRAVICPLMPRMRTTHAALIIGLTWTLSLAVPLPVAVFSYVTQRPDLHGVQQDICVEVWPDDNYRAVFSLVIMTLQYFLPLFVLAFTYTWIAVVIWVKRPPGEAVSGRDVRMAASKRKVRLCQVITKYHMPILCIPHVLRASERQNNVDTTCIHVQCLIGCVVLQLMHSDALTSAERNLTSGKAI